ncbi:glycohydrolase toxin TNT-related protein [Leifsonia sp. NPDC056824]|uniref:glycohydrolase toxin TNT-related protein n=1 Tax=Leifsonia sp. NPDC056824 TaxID=3345953 RepID=UPI0036B55725
MSELALGLEALAASNRIGGVGADAMRAYIREVQLPVVQSLLVGVSTFQTAIGVYWEGYAQVDTDGNFRLVRDEFDAHVLQVDAGLGRLRGFQEELARISADASHLVALGGAGSGAVGATVAEFEGMRAIAGSQRETWEAYEASDAGFNQVKELIGELKSVLKNLGSLTVGRGRSYTAGSFDLTLERLGELTAGMLEYCQANQRAASDGWEAMFSGYAADVAARAEGERREKAGWDLLWDGLQIVAGALITVVGLGLTPFTGGFSLGLTVLGGSLLVGGVNNMINHASIATTGSEFNLVGMASEAVGHWYDVNIAQSALVKGSVGLQFLVGAGAAVGDMVSGGLQVNVKEIGGGVSALVFDADARARMVDQLGHTWDQIVSGDVYVAGYATATVASVLIPGVAAVKASRAGGLIRGAGKADGLVPPAVKLSTPGAATSALDWARDRIGAGVTVVKRQFTPGWTPHPDRPLTPSDALYGHPVADHGSHRAYPPVTDVNRATFDLVADPGAPWGRSPEGIPYSKQEYDVRFTEAETDAVTGHHWDRYPPNDGAVSGTRRDYHDLAAYVRHHGNAVDRIGEDTGEYLGVMRGRKPDSFEQRSLPVNSLELPYSSYHLADDWPPGTKGWTIEHSEIAEGFGRPGGGYQILVRDEQGKTVKVEELLREGVLVHGGATG